MIGWLQTRTPPIQRNFFLLLAAFVVGLTKCYFLQGDRGWEIYVVCLFLGFMVTGLVIVFAGVFSGMILGLDLKQELDHVSVIICTTLIVVCIMLVLGHLMQDADLGGEMP